MDVASITETKLSGSKGRGKLSLNLQKKNKQTGGDENNAKVISSIHAKTRSRRWSRHKEICSANKSSPISTSSFRM